MTHSTVFRLGSKTNRPNCYILQLYNNNHNDYCIDTSVSLENKAIVKFDPNLHPGPEKRIFDIVISKDRNDVTCCLSAVFSFFFFFFLRKWSVKKGKRTNFLSSLKLLWNPSLRGKCQQWQEKNLMGVAFFSCDEERRGIVSELSESVHDEVWASFLGQHALYLFSVSFLFCLFVCLFLATWIYYTRSTK